MVQVFGRKACGRIFGSGCLNFDHGQGEEGSGLWIRTFRAMFDGPRFSESDPAGQLDRESVFGLTTETADQ